MTELAQVYFFQSSAFSFVTKLDNAVENILLQLIIVQTRITTDNQTHVRLIMASCFLITTYSCHQLS